MECRKEESMTEKYFPQVGDNELMLTEMPHMNLYDETDLISNITGDYVDKNYLEWQPIAENTKPNSCRLATHDPEVVKKVTFK